MAAPQFIADIFHDQLGESTECFKANTSKIMGPIPFKWTIGKWKLTSRSMSNPNVVGHDFYLMEFNRLIDQGYTQSHEEYLEVEEESIDGTASDNLISPIHPTTADPVPVKLTQDQSHSTTKDCQQNSNFDYININSLLGIPPVPAVVPVKALPHRKGFIKNPNQERRMFGCDICGSRFIQNSHLTKHYGTKVHHENKRRFNLRMEEENGGQRTAYGGQCTG